jgi:hypothetical protein
MTIGVAQTSVPTHERQFTDDVASTFIEFAFCCQSLMHNRFGPQRAGFLPWRIEDAVNDGDMLTTMFALKRNILQTKNLDAFVRNEASTHCSSELDIFT